MNHLMRCQCGNLKGFVGRSDQATRAVCYCKDCQAYAHILGRADEILDAQGGTQLVAALPSDLRFTQGIEHLTCLSLTKNGLLRWYAECCRTPIGNTPRQFTTPYVGIFAYCLDDTRLSLEQSFGTVRAVLNPKSAIGHVQPTRLHNITATARLMTHTIGARMRGKHRKTPFFNTVAGVPRVQPQVVHRGAQL